MEQLKTTLMPAIMLRPHQLIEAGSLALVITRLCACRRQAEGQQVQRKVPAGWPACTSVGVQHQVNVKIMLAACELSTSFWQVAANSRRSEYCITSASLGN